MRVCVRSREKKKDAINEMTKNNMTGGNEKELKYQTEWKEGKPQSHSEKVRMKTF